MPPFCLVIEFNGRQQWDKSPSKVHLEEEVDTPMLACDGQTIL